MREETNLNGYITTGEASMKINYIYSPRQINKLCEVARIKFIPEEKSPSGKKLVYLNDVIQYAASHPKERYDVVWDAIKPLKSEYFYILKGYDTKIMISNKCRVIDATHGSIINPVPQKDLNGNLTGYYVVGGLMQNGKAKTVTLHTLMGETQCDNELDKKIVHHIKPVNKTNPHINENLASKLLYVWKYQHEELHRLLNEGKTKEYDSMVKAIKKENRQKAYKIPNPAYVSDDKLKYWLYINPNGYREYKKSGNIPGDSIIFECVG